LKAEEERKAAEEREQRKAAEKRAEEKRAYDLRHSGAYQLGRKLFELLSPRKGMLNLKIK
jgi:hypothetical protein